MRAGRKPTYLKVLAILGAQAGGTFGVGSDLLFSADFICLGPPGGGGFWSVCHHNTARQILGELCRMVARANADVRERKCVGQRGRSCSTSSAVAGTARSQTLRLASEPIRLDTTPLSARLGRQQKGPTNSGGGQIVSDGVRVLSQTW